MANLLTNEFLQRYPDFPNEMTPLGKFIYYRTYSRYLPEKRRRETWKETVTRAVDYNCSLAHTSKREAEQLFDNVFHLRSFLSGRTLWVGGTDLVKDFAIANFNCAFEVIDNFEAFRDLFYLLMVGSGVGFRILPEDVKKLPKIKTKVKLKHEEYKPVTKFAREDNTTVEFFGNEVVITVGDSKEGWTQALDTYFKLLWDRMYTGIDRVIINYNHVRPKGERLKRFGGTASGHESLRVMFEKIHKVIEKVGVTTGKERANLQPIDCLDICNIIGENVVSGGVRRTSEISLSGNKDTEVLSAKQYLYTQTEEGEWVENNEILHRRMSNNSILYWERPTLEELKTQLEQIKNTGEPGFINGEQAKQRFIWFMGVNPCAEILLADKGLCNLVSLNATGFVKDGKLDLGALLESARLNARASLRMTCVDLELPKWDIVQKEHRLIGCSLTGWQDMKDIVGMTIEEEERVLAKMKQAIREGADDYADSLGISRPALTTTVKPEGTQSLMPNVSAGVHLSHSPYYIRRVRITAYDPLCKVAEHLGWSVKAEAGQKYETADTKVIEFPVKSPVKRTKADLTAIEQLETYKRFMDFYVEHNCSITVTVKDNEWEEVAKWVHENWDSVVCISFLPYSGGYYPLMPYEEITEEEYNQMLEQMVDFDENLLSIYEQGLDFDLGESECANGVCPIR